MVNIGEISKPTADRSQIKKKLRVSKLDSVAKTGEDSDIVELSQESLDRYEEHLNSHHHDLTSSKDESITKDKAEKATKSIDFRA